jgi:hypothetical protein
MQLIPPHVRFRTCAQWITSRGAGEEVRYERQKGAGANLGVILKIIWRSILSGNWRAEGTMPQGKESLECLSEENARTSIPSSGV